MKTASYDGKWKGEVIFHSPLSIQQEADWEYALARMTKAQKAGGGISATTIALLPGITACVAEWKLKDFPDDLTVDNFPKGNKKDRMELLTWLMEQITEIYKEDEDPNE